MASPKQQILDQVADDAYPLSKGELIALLEERGIDPDVLAVATTLDHERFVSRDELEFRLDDALGMPDADTRRDSAVVDTDWRPADE